MKIFIGYDPRQPVAFQVCAQSVWEHASKPIEIVRLDLRTLPIKRRGLTEFTYSRFLVPYLSGYEGWSLFLDSDILVRGDIHELQQEECPDAMVRIVKGRLKFEWASVMFFNNAACRVLTPEYIENPVHRLYDWAWCPLPLGMGAEYNHLVGYDAPNPDAKIVHFTKGIPVWKETAGCEFASEWIETYRRSCSTVSYQELMGPSVHNQQRVG